MGAGPGDPGLLTVKAQKLLRKADLVAYDHLVSPRILKECLPQARLVYVGKEADHHTASQATINKLLVAEARSGKTIVRLKGGDPVLFGRGGEEALALAEAGVAFEFVPGVTSALAAPAYAGIPVTFRNLSSSVCVVTGHEDPTKPESAVRWEKLAHSADTLVVLMGVGTLKAFSAQLIRHGLSHRTPCAVIEWGTLSRQKTVTAPLSAIAEAAKRKGIRPPAVVVVGEVVSLRKKLAWFEKKPLFGKRVLVTRASSKAEALSQQLESLGAEVEELPAIALAAVKANGVFHKAVYQLPQTDWVFFTSPEGIGWFSNMLGPMRKDLRILKSCRIGAIGPKTAESLEAAGLQVDFVPKRFNQEGMVSGLPKAVVKDKRALIFSALESRDILEEGLREKGLRVKRVPIYQTILPKESIKRVAEVFARPFDLVTVTSASCVDHLAYALKASRLGITMKQLSFASIGPVTSQAVRQQGGRVAVEAAVSTIEGLINATRRYYS